MGSACQWVVFFTGDRNVLELDSVMVAKLCEYTKMYTYLKTEFYSI